jgi:3D (Asp-Asp-Asp) domain-containing protein
MKYIARGSLFFGLFALMMTMFYIQPTVEAALVIANDSHNTQLNIQQILQQDNPFTQKLYTPELKANLTDDPVNSENENSSLAEAKAFRATAYCLKGRTANGSSVRRGIVAADTRIFPLGTRIEIDAGSYSGTYTVADTGGAVRGRILDIWMPNCSEAKRFGRKKVMVSVVGKRKRKK